MTAAKVELGRYLFYERRMSVNGKASCATCHRQSLAFTDGRPVAVGATGEPHSRNAMSLVNVAYAGGLTWNNPRGSCSRNPGTGADVWQASVGAGTSRDDGFLPLPRADAGYRGLFADAFPDESDPLSMKNVVLAIACFERSIVSARSPYDRYHYGRDDSGRLRSRKARRGPLFSQQVTCFRCHGGFNFSDATLSAMLPIRDRIPQHRSLQSARTLSYPAPNLGIYEYTKVPGDVGKFRPDLRNIAVTGPYMHDGSIATLEGVLEHYATGGRTIFSGPNAGVGHNNPNKDPLIGGFHMSAQDRADLVAFLQALTDTAVLHDPRFANPW